MPKTFQDFVADAKTRIKEVNADTLNNMLNDGQEFTLLDTREESEYANGYIGQAINIPRGVIELKVGDTQPATDALIVCYCGGGNRSALVADVMQQMGYTNVVSLAGGWRNWVQQFGS